MTKIWYQIVGTCGEDAVDTAFVEDYDETIAAWIRGEPFKVNFTAASESSWVRGSHVAQIGKAVER